ncbi:MAG TPA: hypothetical protein VJ799_00345 [Nitrososphaeraceae archaeon]|jgi:uncharacterized C2H2 Zn-finger protein|nr:hypothetical protein [Nitrososphaeraceae archaeon]
MFKLNFFKRRKKEEDKGLTKCKYCDMKFQDKERMKRHIRKAHSEKGSDMPSTNPFGGS